MSTLPAPVVVSRATDTNPGPWLALVTWLHFYVGLFVSPFILVAALSGVLYVLSPFNESRLYADVLTTESRGPAHDLRAQVNTALAAVGSGRQAVAVRPLRARAIPAA